MRNLEGRVGLDVGSTGARVPRRILLGGRARFASRERRGVSRRLASVERSGFCLGMGFGLGRANFVGGGLALGPCLRLVNVLVLPLSTRRFPPSPRNEQYHLLVPLHPCLCQPDPFSPSILVIQYSSSHSLLPSYFVPQTGSSDSVGESSAAQATSKEDTRLLPPHPHLLRPEDVEQGRWTKTIQRKHATKY